ncbi:beta-lactamase family protein [Microbacterium maritypicum]|uniref:serine hydrolase domain-containing protein n=1 Tax=Microbacterium maritypicum TaxID=33918 RepID=UPI001B33490F|nr:serine hydrolase domain-containing protein [Microbacterium liquefaciens]MBP5803936.1 beta-lactamase family protein [Microbacterium liquefaciens]
MSSETLVVPLVDQLDAFFGQYTAAGQSPGLVYGLVGADGLEHTRGFGTADDQGNTPDADTVFPIASMTKSFVALGALLARDRGLLDLDARITDFYPQWHGTVGDEPADVPTLRQLLSMGGGLTEDNSWVDPFLGLSEAELVERIRPGFNYSNHPGSAFEYSNIGFTMAGLAVGKAVGRRVEDWVTDEILRPLGMNSTWFDNRAPEGGTLRAVGYSLSTEGEWAGFPPAVSDAMAAAGGMQSTITDLSVWVRFLAAATRPAMAGADDHGAVVSRASRRELQRIHQVDIPSLQARPDGTWKFVTGGYALGLFVREDLHRGRIVTHSGGLPGFILNMVWHADSGVGVVVLTNSHRGNPVALSEDALFRALAVHDTPARTVRPWPETRRLMSAADALVRSWDDDAAAEIFADNIDFDRPLPQRRAAIDELVAQVGPLRQDAGGPEIVSSATPADITWSIPAERGELICMIHLTPVRPAQIQEFEVIAVDRGVPRAARPIDISARRRTYARPTVSPLPNTHVV